MKTYNSQEELKADVKNGLLTKKDSITLTFDELVMKGSIYCKELIAPKTKLDIRGNIECKVMEAYSLDARNIIAKERITVEKEIEAWNIRTKTLMCSEKLRAVEKINAVKIIVEDGDVYTDYLKAESLYCNNILVHRLLVDNISYKKSCVATKTLRYKQILGRAKNAEHMLFRI